MLMMRATRNGEPKLPIRDVLVPQITQMMNEAEYDERGRAAYVLLRITQMVEWYLFGRTQRCP